MQVIYKWSPSFEKDDGTARRFLDYFVTQRNWPNNSTKDKVGPISELYLIQTT